VASLRKRETDATDVTREQAVKMKLFRLQVPAQPFPSALPSLHIERSRLQVNKFANSHHMSD
jgi:hypothetical protein